MKLHIRNNPFNSQTFEKVWAEFHNLSQKLIIINFIDGLKFYKHKFLPIYYNMGNNHTNGISYTLNFTWKSLMLANKVILIKDIPEYFNIEVKGKRPKNLKCHKIRQYKGYLADFKNITCLDSYMENNISPNSRSQIRRFSRKIEKDFKIEFEVFYGYQMDKDKFDYLFNKFFQLLESRFASKQEYVHHLKEKNKKYIRSLFWKMVPEKKAAIFVTFANGIPISINLNFSSDKCLFSFLPSFDTEYSKYKPGVYTLKKIFDWSINNNFRIYDFSKGEFDYKKSWCNQIYNFEYHIYYDSSSFKSALIAKFFQLRYLIWQFLRDNKIHIYYRKVRFSLTNYLTKIL